MSFGLNMNKKIVGLDIRSDSISAVVVRTSMKGNWIEAYTHTQINDKTEVEQGIENNTVKALENICKKLDIIGSICVSSFNADKVSYRNIQIPFSENKKIRQILPFELEPMLPFPVDDLLIDFHIVKSTSNQTDLIATTIKKTDLSEYLNNFENLQIEPEIVTIGGYTTVLCLINFGEMPEKWLFIDIDNKKSTLFLIIKKKICLIRIFPTNDPQTPHIDAVCKNIRRTLSAFEESHDFDEIHPDKIIITGFGLPDPDFDKQLSQNLEIPVELADLARDAKIAIPFFDDRPWKPEKLDNALSLALIETLGISGVNFRKGEFLPKKQWAANKKSFIKTGILAAFAMLLAFLSLLIDSYNMERTMRNLNSQIMDIFKSSFPDVKNIVDPLQQMKAKIQEEKKRYFSSEESGKTIRTVDVLQTISTRIPTMTDLELDRFVVSPDSVLISGNTDTFNSVNDIKNRLEGTDIFKKVTISSADTDKSGNRVNFKLKVDL